VTDWHPPCTSANNCLQVGTTGVDGEPLTLRSSRREGQVITVDADEWARFLVQVKAGEYDHTT